MDLKWPKKTKKGLIKVQNYQRSKKVQILPSEAAEKWLKMSQINAKGPTVHFDI